MPSTQTLPKKGEKIYAWIPKLHKEVAATVESIRGSKLTVTVYTGDNGLEKFSGIEKWKPVEKNNKLKGDQLPLPDPEIIKTIEGAAEVIEPETPAEEPSKIFDTIKISEIWPTPQDFYKESDEAKKLQPRNGIDSDTVERYAEIFDALPPIDVFKVPGREGFCIAGGWHRREAAIKLVKEEIAANIHYGTLEEAIVFAATDNLQSGLQLTKWEIEEACKNLLRVADLLPASKVSEIVADINKRFKKKATELSNVVIALMFGISDRTVANYRKDLELEKLIAQFEVGQRVEISEKKLPETPVEYRRGKIDSLARHRIIVVIDFPDRVTMQYCDPSEVSLTDEPVAEIEIHKNLTPGDKVKHWKTGEVGIVAAVNWENPNSCWGWIDISRKKPVILFERKLEAASSVEFDLLGAGEPPALEECLIAARYHLQDAQKKDDLIGFSIERLVERIKYLEGLVNPPTAEPTATDAPAQSTEPTPAVKYVTTEMGTTPAPAPTPTELKTFTNAKAEVEAKGKQLGLNGNGKQQLPTVEHEEDPVVTGRVSPAAVATTARKASLVTEILEILEEAAPDQDEALEILKRLKKYLPQDWKEML